MAQQHFPVPEAGRKESHLPPDPPRPSSGPGCPFGLQSRPTGSAAAPCRCASPQEKPLLPTGGPQASRGAQGKEQPNPTRSLPRPRLARGAQTLQPPFVKSRMSTEECLALPSRTERQLERLIFTAHGRRNAQVSSGAGQVGESPGRGGGLAFLFFGRTTGCRKINLSAWLGPAIGLVLHKQSSTSWFCSITTTAGPFWGAHWLLQATLMREEYNSMRGRGRNLTPWACTSTAKSLLSLSSALITCFLWHL